MKIIDQFPSLPADWRLTPLKAVCDFAVSNVDKHSLDGEIPVRLCNYTDVYKNEKVSTRMELMRATATSQEIEKFRLKAGDVVITKDSESWDDIGIPSFVSETEDDFVCGYHLALIRSNRSQIDGQFLFRCMQSRVVAVQLELEATGVTRFGLPKESIGNALLPLPPIATQRRIVDYLDRETGRIDALIAAKERLLALFAEKRAALISQLVTRGLDPNVPTKPSGLDWVGEIPKHWEVRRLKYVATLNDETLSEDTKPDYEFTYIDIGNVDSKEGIIKTEKHCFSDAPSRARRIVRDGDIIISTVRTYLQAIAAIRKPAKAPLGNLIASTGFAVIRPGIQLNAGFCRYVLREKYFLSEVERRSVGVSYPAINASDLENIEISVPPIEDQEAIATYLDWSVWKIDALMVEIQRSIVLLRERRAALISAAVCGQLSV